MTADSLIPLVMMYFASKKRKGLPGFPGSGWVMYKTLPKELVQRAGQAGQFVQPGGYYVEQTGGRWTLYARLAQGLGTFHLATDKGL